MNRGALLLRKWRGDRTQRAVATEFDIATTELSDYEHARRVPARRRAIMFRDVAGIPVDAWDEPSDEPATQAK